MSPCLVNGSAVRGAHRLEEMVRSTVKGLSVSDEAMNFYWQHTPQVHAAYWGALIHSLPTLYDSASDIEV